MLHLNRFLACGAALAAIAHTPATAQANERPAPAPYLDTVTVIGTGLPTEVMRNPASITVISADDIEQTAPVSIAALLRDVPGVDVSEEGIERVAIRGEGARRVAILIDGQRLTDHTNYGQPVLVDPTTIERIEVVRGASSVISGSSAIGGVINIITKKGAAQPFALSATAGYISATRGHRLSATASGTVKAGSGAVDYRLSLGRMEQEDRRTPGGQLKPSDVRDRNVSAHLGYRLGAHYFGLKTQSYDLGANVYTGIPSFIIELPRRDLRKSVLFYEGTHLTPWLTRLDVNLYHQRIDREFRNDVTRETPPRVAPAPPAPAMRVRVQSSSLDKQASSGVQLRAEMKFSAGSRTVAGLEWEDDAITSDKTTYTTRTPLTAPMPGVPVPSLRFDKAKTTTYTVFGQHELKLGNEFTATLGARAWRVRATHQASTDNGAAARSTKGTRDTQLLGSASLVWTPAPHLALRANASQGYIYPTLAQLFLTTTGGGTTLVGNPNLKPETSTTYELGARYASGTTVLDATLFHARARDYISTVSVGGAAGPGRPGSTNTYRNVDAARSFGLELHAEHGLREWGLTPYASLTVMRRQLRYANGYHTYDSGTPNLAGRIGLRKDWRVGHVAGTVDLFVRGESRVRLRTDAGNTSGSGRGSASEGNAPGYGTLGLRTHADFGQGSSLVLELGNLTNRRYQAYGQMPGAGRSVNLFLTHAF